MDDKDQAKDLLKVIQDFVDWDCTWTADGDCGECVFSARPREKGNTICYSLQLIHRALETARLEGKLGEVGSVKNESLVIRGGNDRE